MRVEADFQTQDGTKFHINTKTERWALHAGSGDGAVSDKGALTPLGLGSFSLEPRTPKTEGPGAGLCVVAIYAVIEGDTLRVFAKGNRPIEAFTLAEPIVNQVYETIP